MIELQVVGKDARYFFVRNKGSEVHWDQDKIKKELDSGQRLLQIMEEEMKAIKALEDKDTLYAGHIDKLKIVLPVLEGIMKRSRSE